MPDQFDITLDVKQSSTYYSARCADVPGLHITGRDLADVRQRAMPAVKLLLARNRQVQVEVTPTDDLRVLRVKVLPHAAAA